MPDIPDDDPQPDTDADRANDRTTDRAPEWNCDAPTRSDRGSGRILTAAQTVEMSGEEASDIRAAEDEAPAAPPILLIPATPTRALDDLTDDFETADTK